MFNKATVFRYRFYFHLQLNRILKKAYSVGPPGKATFKPWFGTDSTKGPSEIDFVSFLLVG
jgi:hypothetical protein